MEPAVGPLPPGLVHLILLGVSGMLMLVDLLTSMALHPGKFSWLNGGKKKAIKLAVFPVALAMDAVITLLGWNFLGLPAFDTVVRNVLPFTLLTLVYFIISESTLILERVAESEEQKGLAVKLLWLLQQIQLVDKERFPGPGKPRRRWWEVETVEEARALVDRLEQEERDREKS